jgi:hypothetical protein
MQKGEYLQVHVKHSKGKLVVSANGEQVIDATGTGIETELAHYLNSLGGQGWEMVNADKNEYGFQNCFFKRPIE